MDDPALLASPYAFPGGQDPHGLPPTFILNSDVDGLRPSGESFASEIAAAGVDLLLIREDGTRHGHLNEPSTPGAARSVERLIAWLVPNPSRGGCPRDVTPLSSCYIMTNPTVASLLARSNRLGSIPKNTNYAGGSTSAKCADADFVRRAG